MTDLGNMLARLAFDELGADYLLATRFEHGNVCPVLIAKGERVGDVRFEVPYQLVTILESIYPWIPDGRTAMVVRRCDEKALAELSKRKYIDDGRIVKIGLACSKEQIERCRCSDPVPSKVHFGEPQKGLDKDWLAERLEAMTADERLAFWVDQYRKCNKCFGCTLNCPVCFCDDECVLGERTFVPEQGIPPGLSFHMIRSYHMIDKCVECGECERACPAEIPLLTMRKLLLRELKQQFGFAPGDEKSVSPLNTTLDGEPLEDECHEY